MWFNVLDGMEATCMNSMKMPRCVNMRWDGCMWSLGLGWD